MISLAAVGGAREEKMYDEMVSAFERANPDIRVKRMDVPSRSFFTKLQVMVAGGMAPDLDSDDDHAAADVCASPRLSLA